MLIDQPEILRFANGVCGLGAGNIRIDTLSFEGGRAAVSFTLPEDVKSAAVYVYYRTSGLEYEESRLKEDWSVKKGVALGGCGNVRVPDEAQLFYILIEGRTGSLFDRKPIYASTGIFTREALGGDGR